MTVTIIIDRSGLVHTAPARVETKQLNTCNYNIVVLARDAPAHTNLDGETQRSNNIW